MNRKSLIPMMIVFATLGITTCGNEAVAQPYPPIVTFEQATPSTYEDSPILTVTSPMEGEVVSIIRDCDTCPAFIEFDASLQDFELGVTSSGYFPCEPVQMRNTCRWKGDGQYIFVAIDKSTNRSITDLNATNYIPLPDTTPGPHTLTVFLSRSWDESLKNTGSISASRVTDLYTVLTFYVGSNTGTHAIDTTKALLTPSSPLDTSTYKYPVDSVLFDFYMMFEGLAGGYVVEATVYDSTMQALGRDTLTDWVPYCIKGLAEPPVGRLGKYLMRARLLDGSGIPVANGPGNFNDRMWAFWVRRH